MNNPPTSERIDSWIKQKIAVRKRPDWIFVKVYTHGAQDKHLKDEYFENLNRMFSYLEKKYNDGVNFRLHYVTAREMFNIVKAAESGEKLEPGEYRDYLLVSNTMRHCEARSDRSNLKTGIASSALRASSQ